MEKLDTKHQNIFLAGFGSFIKIAAYTSLGSPLEVVRLRLQNSTEMIKQGYLPNNYKGIIDTIKKIAKEERPIGFWKGNFIHIVRQSISTLSYFLIADKFSQTINQYSRTDSKVMQFYQNILSGGISGSIVLSICYPLESARIKLTNDIQLLNIKQKQYNSILDVYKKILSIDGTKGLYRGFGISCIGIFMYRGMFYGLTDFCCKLEDMPIMNSLQMQFLLGWVIKFTTQIITYPFYTISSRMIMTSGQNIKYKDSFHCLQKIVRYEGVKSLFRGISINIFKSLGGASTFILYSLYLQKQQNSKIQN